MKTEDWSKTLYSFKTFNEMFELLSNGDFTFLDRKCGTMEYPEIKWMIEYFSGIEEYEKCSFLLNINVPPATNRETK